MKSEHRHELKTNELERLTSEWGRASERYVHQHTNQILIAAVVVAVVAIGVAYWRFSAGSFDSQAWRALSNATNAADFGTVADKYANTPVAQWARLREGEAEFATGIRLMFTDRDAGRSDLKKAQENFEKIVGDKSAPSDVVERAYFGLARCREALPDKNAQLSKINEPAIETYQRLLKLPNSDNIFKEIAEARIAALKTGTAEDFSSWFAAQNPKPADREMPKDLIPPLPDGPPAAGQSGSTDGHPAAGAAPAPAPATGAAPAKSGPTLFESGSATPKPAMPKPATSKAAVPTAPASK